MDLIFVHLTQECAAFIVSQEEAHTTFIIFQFEISDKSLGKNSNAIFLKANVGQYHKCRENKFVFQICFTGVISSLCHCSPYAEEIIFFKVNLSISKSKLDKTSYATSIYDFQTIFCMFSKLMFGKSLIAHNQEEIGWLVFIAELKLIVSLLLVSYKILAITSKLINKKTSK
jgi:hypothetical protein